MKLKQHSITISLLFLLILLQLILPFTSQNLLLIQAQAPPPVQFTTSNLPIIAINTFGVSLNSPATPKTAASIRIWYNPNRQVNSQFDAPDYEGTIGIKVRGHSSSDFPKKKFTIEFWQNATTNSLNYPFLGLPAESDFVLCESHNFQIFFHSIQFNSIQTNQPIFLLFLFLFEL